MIVSNRQTQGARRQRCTLRSAISITISVTVLVVRLCVTNNNKKRNRKYVDATEMQLKDSTEIETVPCVESVANQTVRPLLLFKHNPKAAGGSVIRLLKEFKPNFYRAQHALNKDLCDGNTNKLTPNMNIPSSFIFYAETDQVDPDARDFGFVISSIREPCDQYVSLWAYGSANKGHLRHAEMQMKSKLYGKDAPHFDSERDIKAFHRWLRDGAARKIIGRRFIQSYGEHHDKKGMLPQNVDCWIYVDDFQKTLYTCLREYEIQGGFVNWTSPTLSKLVSDLQKEMYLLQQQQKSHDEEKDNSPIVQGDHYEKDNAIENNQLSHHSRCSMYYNDALADMIRYGSEAFIYDMFGYDKCCGSRQNPRNKIILPPPMILTEQHLMKQQEVRNREVYDEQNSIKKYKYMISFVATIFIISVFFLRWRIKQILKRRIVFRKEVLKRI